MNLEEKYEWIEKYLAGKLSGEELAGFNAKVKQDAGFAQEVNLHREVQETIKDKNLHKLRSTLKKVDSGWTNPSQDGPTKVVSFPYLRWASVAAIGLLLLLAYQFLLPNPTTTLAENFDTHFQPYKMILNQRDGDESNVYQIKLKQAIKAYENENYAQSGLLFEELNREKPGQISTQFYQAMSNLAAQNTESAIVGFKDLLKKKDHLFEEQSEWYLALAYLQLGNPEQAKDILQKITPEAFNYKEARAILKSL